MHFLDTVRSLVGRANAPRLRQAWIQLGVALVGWAAPVSAQNPVSVPFPNGFIGTRGSNPQDAQNVSTFATLGIARIFFIQSSPSNQFVALQGNDVAGTIRLVGTNGQTLDVPGSVVWRQNSGSTTILIGFIPKPPSPVTWTYGAGSKLTISSGMVSGGSNIGGYLAGYAGPYAANGSNQNGNAASTILNDLNAYLATVAQARPAGPVTVNALSTASSTPTITGSATLQSGETFSVIVAGVEYRTTTSPAVVVSGTSWSLALTTPLAPGTYSVAATITNTAGYTLSDATTDELTITAPVLTVGGTLTADSRTYTGTTLATGNLGGLTLQGIISGDTVTIASAALAFASAGVGNGKIVSITSLTLGGPHAGRYTVSLAGAPTATAAITAQPLTIGGLAITTRAYDGTTAAPLGGTPTYVGLQNGETFAVAGTPSASYATAGVGTGKAVTVLGYAAPSANYAVTQPTGLTGAITPKVLAIGGTFTAADKPFDGTTTATISTAALSLPGAIGGDDVSVTSLVASFATPNLGQGKPVTLTSAALTGAAAGNYALSLVGAPTTTASITAAAVRVGGSFLANDKVYSGTTTATGNLSGLVLEGVITGDTVTIASLALTFASAAVGDGKIVTITSLTLGGPHAGRYAPDLTDAPTALAAITPKLLTLGGTFTATDKLHDGTTIATVGTHALLLQGVVSGDQVSVTGLVANFATPDLGLGKPVTLTAASLAGAAAGNYLLSLVGAPTATASITLPGGPPSAPHALGAGVNPGQLELTWQLPADLGCGPVTMWAVEYRRQGDAAWVARHLVGGGHRSTTLQPLHNNVAYEVRLAAINDCGQGAFASLGPLVPVGPGTSGGTGTAPITAPPGVVIVAVDGGTSTVTPEILQDTMLRIMDRGVTLVLQAFETTLAPMPVDPSHTLLLEHGGQVGARGDGFMPGTYVTMYLYAASGEPHLLAMVRVHEDGTFLADAPIDGTWPPGAYTVQIHGVDHGGRPRSTAIGVEIEPHPPVLILTATPDDETPVVGDTITVTLIVTNQGTGPATDVEIHRAFDEPGFRIIAATPRDGTYDLATMRWHVPHIAAGGNALLWLTLLVLPPAAEGHAP